MGAWDSVGAGTDIRVVVRVILPDDFDDNAYTHSKRVTATEHVPNELLHARPRYQLSRELVGANALLLVLRCIGRDGNDGLDEVTRSGLDDPAVLWAEERE